MKEKGGQRDNRTQYTKFQVPTEKNDKVKEDDKGRRMIGNGKGKGEGIGKDEKEKMGKNGKGEKEERKTFYSVTRGQARKEYKND